MDSKNVKDRESAKNLCEDGIKSFIKGEYSKTISNCKKSIECDSGHQKAYIYLAKALLLQARSDEKISFQEVSTEALEYCKKVHEINQTYHYAYKIEGYIHILKAIETRDLKYLDISKECFNTVAEKINIKERKHPSVEKPLEWVVLLKSDFEKNVSSIKDQCYGKLTKHPRINEDHSITRSNYGDLDSDLMDLSMDDTEVVKENDNIGKTLDKNTNTSFILQNKSSGDNKSIEIDRELNTQSVKNLYTGGGGGDASVIKNIEATAVSSRVGVSTQESSYQFEDLGSGVSNLNLNSNTPLVGRSLLEEQEKLKSMYNHEYVRSVYKEWNNHELLTKVLHKMRQDNTVDSNIRDLLKETVERYEGSSELQKQLIIMIESICESLQDSKVKEKINNDCDLSEYSEDGLFSNTLVDLVSILNHEIGEEKSAEIIGFIEDIYDC